MLALSCGSTPSAPAAPSTVHGSSVVITGPAKAIVGGSAQLTAAINFADGSQKPCPTATWSSSATSTATVSSSGVVQALAPGDVIITASCGSTVGTLAFASLAKIAIQGSLHESAPTIATAIAGATVSIVDAAGQQLSATTDGAGHFSLTAAAGPATLQASQAGYQPALLTLTLAESGAGIDVALSPVNQDISLGGTASVCSTEPKMITLCDKEGTTARSNHVSIDVHNPGTLTIQTWWSLDFADLFEVDVLCGGQSIYHLVQRDSSEGKANTVQVPGGCRYDVVFTMDSGDYPTVTYRYAIKHPS